MPEELRKNNEYREWNERLAFEKKKKKEIEGINEHAILKELAEQANEAFKRGRSALLILFLASVVLGVGFFNHRGSWLFTSEYSAEEKRNASEFKDPINSNLYSDKTEAVVDAINRNSENDKPEYKRHLLHDIWDGNFKTLEVPALGIEFYALDLPLVGSFGLLIVFGYFYVFRRRERGVIQVIRDKVNHAKKTKNIHVIEYLFNSLALDQVFITVNGIDNDSNDLEDPDITWITFFKDVLYFILILGLIIASYFICSTFNDQNWIKAIWILSFVGLLMYFLLPLIENKDISKSIKVFNLGRFPQKFLNFGLLFPSFILSVVITHDVYETYAWKPRGLQVPYPECINACRDALDSMKSLVQDIDSINNVINSAKWSETEFGALRRKRIVDSSQLDSFNFTKEFEPMKSDEGELKYYQFDSCMAYLNFHYFHKNRKKYLKAIYNLNCNHRDTCSYEFKTYISSQIKEMKDTEEVYRRRYLRDTTLGGWIKINKLYYEKMRLKNFRIFGFWTGFTMEMEVLGLRTIIPSSIIIICLIITIAILRLQGRMHEDFIAIHKIYREIQNKKRFFVCFEGICLSKWPDAANVFERDLIQLNNQLQKWSIEKRDFISIDDFNSTNEILLGGDGFKISEHVASRYKFYFSIYCEGIDKAVEIVNSFDQYEKFNFRRITEIEDYSD